MKRRQTIFEGRAKDANAGYSYWDTHRYQKRSVANNFAGYCGDDYLTHTVKPLDSVTQGLFSTIFLTGGRASEVLTLTPKHFSVEDKVIVVRNMMVLKRRKKFPRTFPIRMDEPLVEYLTRTIENTDKGEPLFPYKYHWLYKTLCKVDSTESSKCEWFPHRLRAERASHLVTKYGFDVINLMAFYGWASTETPAEYVRLTPTDLINKMFKGEI